MTRNPLVRRATAAVVAAAAVFGGSVLATGPVSAQEAPGAEAASTCDPEALILVGIDDVGEDTFDVYIDGELVDEGVTGSGEDVYAYGPVDDGTYNVVVTWLDGDEDILDTDVAVDCGPEPTTTTTTAAPSTTAVSPSTTVAPTVRPAAAAPIKFTG